MRKKIDFASADYDKVDKQLHESLGEPVAIVYEKYSVDNTRLQMSAWYWRIDLQRQCWK